MIMKKQESEILMKALESSLNSEEWDVQRNGDNWFIVSKGDERKLQLPVHELKEQLEQSDNPEEREQIVQQFVSRAVQALPATAQSIQLREQKQMLYPVIRSASFPTEGSSGRRLVYREHTAESIVLYALDFGESYVLVNEDMAAASKATADEVHRWALQNVKRLSNEPKMDFVADNRFYFFSQDHYAASRILNDKLLADMKKKVKGEMAVAIPHQDVMIVADLHNSAGYNVLGQIAMKFYGEGQIPITPLPMVVEENGELTPILVLPETIKQKKTFK